MSNNAMIVAPRTRGREKGSGSSRTFLLVLFGVFFLVMLVVLLLGLQSYRAIADERNATDESRLAHGALVNTVKAFDALDAFAVDEYEGNDVLAMTQRTVSGTYLMRLYVHDGELMQQFSLADEGISPESAHALFATDTFAVAYADGLLTLTTDDAEPCIRLVCPQTALVDSLAQRAASATEAGDA